MGNPQDPRTAPKKGWRSAGALMKPGARAGCILSGPTAGSLPNGFGHSSLSSKPGRAESTILSSSRRLLLLSESKKISLVAGAHDDPKLAKIVEKFEVSKDWKGRASVAAAGLGANFVVWFLEVGRSRAPPPLPH